MPYDALVILHSEFFSFMLYPFTFHPIFKERVWGGRKLSELYGKPLPPGVPIGESWEITDRPEGVSVIANGPLAGKDLRWLMENHAEELLGRPAKKSERFPLLVKILDAREKLSLQVHPPAAKAAELGGEPKTEMWYVADAAPDAEIFVGLKHGVTRAEFERKVRDGTVAECVHRQPVKRGDAMFLPSGRVHALGGGNVIFEIQQNSDTTYRVFDWNRAGLDGKPRELHLEPALASIDFADFEPPLLPTDFPDAHPFGGLTLSNNPLFTVFLNHDRAHWGPQSEGIGLFVIALIKGRLEIDTGGNKFPLKPGDFCVVPACCQDVDIWPETDAAYLLIRPR